MNGEISNVRHETEAVDWTRNTLRQLISQLRESKKMDSRKGDVILEYSRELSSQALRIYAMFQMQEMYEIWVISYIVR